MKNNKDGEFLNIIAGIPPSPKEGDETSINEIRDAFQRLQNSNRFDVPNWFSDVWKSKERFFEKLFKFFKRNKFLKDFVCKKFEMQDFSKNLRNKQFCKNCKNHIDFHKN